MRAKASGILALFFLVVLTLPSCKTRDTAIMKEKKISVITSLFPLYDFARNAAGQKAVVTLLLPPGVEPHSFELKPGDILKLNGADIFIYTGKFMEPWVDDALAGIHNPNLVVVDSSAGIPLLWDSGEDQLQEHDHKGNERGADPHIWLDFSNAQRMVDTIRDALVKKDPADKDYYVRNAETYKGRLNKLDEKFKASLSHCRKNLFVHGGHFAFQYLAKRYGLKYLSAYPGFSPDAEPTPRELAELTNRLKEEGLHYIFYEELIRPNVAETLAKETGAHLLMLHGAHNVTREEMERGVTFLSIMEKNLENLRIGLQCQ
ncbi:MAG TPA: zinc-binding protein [Nitrospiraceae bacterium]|nr:zinc-binding protein [Nitrospiraceae bacterium]